MESLNRLKEVLETSLQSKDIYKNNREMIAYFKGIECAVLLVKQEIEWEKTNADINRINESRAVD